MFFMTWPNNIPDDLRARLETVMGYRSSGPAEIWDTVREWLEAQGADATLKILPLSIETECPRMTQEEMEELEALAVEARIAPDATNHGRS